MTAPSIRSDADRLTFNVAAAVAEAMAGDAPARRLMFTDAAITASLQAQALGVGPLPLRFLADYVRAAGRSAALGLTEPLMGAEPTALARSWLTAAGVDGGPENDDVFGEWLDSVAALIALRLRSGRPR